MGLCFQHTAILNPLLWHTQPCRVSWWRHTHPGIFFHLFLVLAPWCVLHLEIEIHVCAWLSPPKEVNPTPRLLLLAVCCASSMQALWFCWSVMAVVHFHQYFGIYNPKGSAGSDAFHQSLHASAFEGKTRPILSTLCLHSFPLLVLQALEKALKASN